MNAHDLRNYVAKSVGFKLDVNRDFNLVEACQSVFGVETPGAVADNATTEIDETLERWVATTLANDEASTDSELVEHFTEGGPMPTRQANFYIAQRNDALRSPLHFSLKSYKANQ